MNFIQIADEWTSDTREYEIFMEFPFDSTRKRMSLICKEMESEELIMYMKGADSIMFPRLNIDTAQLDKLEADLSAFAKKGLRTLVMGKKMLSFEVYDEWKERYDLVNTSNDLNKDDQLCELYDQLEYNFEYLGSSAIEDLLQDKVPETIADLMSANIRLWVLTGDKQETAIEIGKSCNLINEREMELVIFSSKNKEEFTDKLTHYLLAPPKKSKMSLVIDGSTLTFVLEDEYLAKAFFQYGCKANSVICCRVSPKQKSDVVALAKRNGPWVTLAIGDGANDVSMIMEAHIGIGIRGKEGSQAARTADYAIGQFKFLKNLLFTHGRWGYRRISLFI
jgi:magnesium-transporting ATPase (P-type)